MTKYIIHQFGNKNEPCNAAEFWCHEMHKT